MNIDTVDTFTLQNTLTSVVKYCEDILNQDDKPWWDREGEIELNAQQLVAQEILSIIISKTNG